METGDNACTLDGGSTAAAPDGDKQQDGWMMRIGSIGITLARDIPCATM